MILGNHAGHKPRIDGTAFIHPSAVVIGSVQIGEKVFVGPDTVIRADSPGIEGEVAAIVIESDVIIQDGVTISAPDGAPVRIEKGASLAHGAVITGPCDVGRKCFIGFDSAVFKATLGNGVVIQHKAHVEGVAIETGMHVPPMNVVLDQKDVRELSPAPTELTTLADTVRRSSTILAEVN